MENKELLPCPFCGGKAKIGTTSHGHDVMSVYAVCTHCDAQGPIFMYDYWQYKKQMEQRGKARTAWNTRTNTIPVKYGQTLWRIDGNGFRSPEFQKAVPVTVQEIVFKDVRGKPQWSFIASSTMFSFGGIGKTVFLTKEEAEKVIAKRRSGNET